VLARIENDSHIGANDRILINGHCPEEEVQKQAGCGSPGKDDGVPLDETICSIFVVDRRICASVYDPVGGEIQSLLSKLRFEN
jgi:hypothetical protein